MPIEPTGTTSPIEATPPAGPSYLPLAAHLAAAERLAPPAPTWTKAYELPSARRVVSSGLQLAVDASKPIRRASIYIGLLALGSFGPAVVLLLLAIGKFLAEPGAADTILNDPSRLFLEHPEYLTPILLIYALVLSGFVLLIAISIDAQAIAISILAGRASDRPVQLFEAITRARQVFWRLLGAGFVVGIASFVIQLVLTLPFLRPNDSNQGLAFIALAIATLVLSPFAFAATGIVLGDVGAIESLRRSVALFRARKRIALTVTVFTLVTSAIQSFALGAGVDVAVRVGDAMHLSLDLGGPSLVVAAVIVLAVVMAFGSLTFTIAAIVAAPQVAAFLGLTYHSAGLDRARSVDGARPRRFRWVSIPMALIMVGLLIVAGVGLPSVVGLQPTAASPLFNILSAAADDNGYAVIPTGASVLVEDPDADSIGTGEPWTDIQSAGYALLPVVPDWLLDSLFDCGSENVTCPGSGLAAGRWEDGAYLFVQHMAGPPDALQGDDVQEWGPMLALTGFPRAPIAQGDPFGGASHAFITRVEPARRRLLARVFSAGKWVDYPAHGRSAWIGNDLLTLIPLVQDMPGEPGRWDAYAARISPTAQGGLDLLRASAPDALLVFSAAPELYIYSTE